MVSPLVRVGVRGMMLAAMDAITAAIIGVVGPALVAGILHQLVRLRRRLRAAAAAREERRKFDERRENHHEVIAESLLEVTMRISELEVELSRLARRFDRLEGELAGDEESEGV